MRVMFTASLLRYDQEHTGAFVARVQELGFLPSPGMEVDGFGLQHSRKVLDVSIDLEAKQFDAYVRLSGITCPTEEDYQQTIERLKGQGWEIRGK